MSGLAEFAALCANYDIRRASGKVSRVRHDIVKVASDFSSVAEVYLDCAVYARNGDQFVDKKTA